MSWGDWDGLTADEIARKSPIQWQSCIDTGFRTAPPDGESVSAARRRAREWLSALSPHHNLIVVTHGMMGRALRSIYRNLDIAAMDHMAYEHGTVYELIDGREIEHTA